MGTLDAYAKNTQDLIEKTINEITTGSMLLEKTNGAFESTIAHNKSVGQLIEEIAFAANEQAEGIEQINGAISQMDKIVQQNAANAEESASASEELNTQAHQLKLLVDRIAELVGGSKR